MDYSDLPVIDSEECFRIDSFGNLEIKTEEFHLVHASGDLRYTGEGRGEDRNEFFRGFVLGTTQASNCENSESNGEYVLLCSTALWRKGTKIPYGSIYDAIHKDDIEAMWLSPLPEEIRRVEG